MKIKEIQIDTFSSANEVEFRTCFKYLEEYFQIEVSFYNDGEYKCSQFIHVDPNSIKEWMETAKQHPEKANFLNFSIIIEWACQQLNIELIR